MIIYLLGGWPTPLKNDGVSSSVGMMKFPTEWKNKPNVPNHPSVIYIYMIIAAIYNSSGQNYMINLMPCTN